MRQEERWEEMTKKSYTVEKDWTTAAGLRAVVILIDRSDKYSMVSFSRWRCGYVAVPEGCELHGRGYSDLTDDGRRVDYVLSAHGGVTFGEGTVGDWYPVEAEGVSWLGFDACHYYDEMEPKGLSYMEAECEGLARQIVAFKSEPKPDDPTDADQGVILAIRYRPTGKRVWCYSVAPHRGMVDDIQGERGRWDIEAVILTQEQLDELHEFEGW